MVNEQIMMLIMMMALVRLVVSDNDRPNKMVIMIYIYDRKVLTVMFSLFLPCLDLFSWFFMVPGWFSWFISKMYTSKVYPGPTIHSRSAARRAAWDLVLIMMMALVRLVVSDYDRPNKRTKRGGELDGGRKRAGINDHSAATEKI